MEVVGAQKGGRNPAEGTPGRMAISSFENRNLETKILSKRQRIVKFLLLAHAAGQVCSNNVMSTTGRCSRFSSSDEWKKENEELHRNFQKEKDMGEVAHDFGISSIVSQYRIVSADYGNAIFICAKGMGSKEATERVNMQLGKLIKAVEELLDAVHVLLMTADLFDLNDNAERIEKIKSNYEKLKLTLEVLNELKKNGRISGFDVDFEIPEEYPKLETKVELGLTDWMKMELAWRRIEKEEEN